MPKTSKTKMKSYNEAGVKDPSEPTTKMNSERQDEKERRGSLPYSTKSTPSEYVSDDSCEPGEIRSENHDKREGGATSPSHSTSRIGGLAKVLSQDKDSLEYLQNMQAAHGSSSESPARNKELVAKLKRAKYAFRIMEATKDREIQDIRSQAAARIRDLEDENSNIYRKLRSQAKDFNNEKAQMRQRFEAKLDHQSSVFDSQMGHMEERLQDLLNQQTGYQSRR
ncbi:hypothetical protein FGRMN_8555 [Fusarium graminum]|nr:hypothetical protein FGRMN_8555 [Fusarium graminum]